MKDLNTRLLELGLQGFECSQIMMILALETEGKQNPDLIRAMGGLNGGLGHCGNICGALTGGCCVLGLFTQKGEAQEMEHNHSREIIDLYLRWFEEEIGSAYGGVLCKDIIDGDFSKSIQICAPIVEKSYQKIMELLYENGVMDYDLFE